VDVLRHAVAIDERRCWFPTFPCLSNTYAPEQNIREVWFAGVHTDVGGGERESECGLSKVTLLWMVHEAMQHGLLVDPARLAAIIPARGSQGAGHCPPDPLAPRHESLRSWWWIPECLPSPDLRGGTDLQVKERSSLWVPSFGRRRRVIPEGAIVHQAVLDRKNSREDYEPRLPSEYRVEAWPPGWPA
jgi:uncharacterized protein (DUF2235 family)